jgi:hypothetical protein
VLAHLLAAAALSHFPEFTPELVIWMPARPGQEDRFVNIRREVARRTAAADAGAVLRQTRAVADYRHMTLAQRKAAAGGPCAAHPSVRADQSS